MPRKKGPNEKAMSLADKEVLDHYGQLIRKYRKMSDISRIKLCELVDISNSQLSKWECGGAEPRLHSMIRICEVLNIPLEELLFNVKTRRISVDEAKTIKLLRETPDNIRKNVYELLNTVNRSVRAASSTAKEVLSEPSTPYVSLLREPNTTFPNNAVENNTNLGKFSDESGSKEVDNGISHKKRGRPAKKKEAASNVKHSAFSETPEETIQKVATVVKSGNESILEETSKPRKRGRPAKAPDPIIEASKETTEKRKRGRPRKIANDNISEEIVQAKRKRGRPKRSEIEEMLTPISD